MFFIQLLLGRHAIYETPEGSDISKSSPLAVLHTSWQSLKVVLDQCALGAVVEGRPVKKATELHSSMNVSECEPSLARRCSRDHAHHMVRGTTRAGINYSALAAAYPEKMCEPLVRLAKSA